MNNRKQLAVLTIASEQVWPAIEFLMLCKKIAKSEDKAIAKVCILCTSDEAFSKRPAESLKAFCEVHFKVQVQIAMLDSGMPSAVRQALRQHMDSEHLWILNYTNGTKPMSAPIGELSSRNDVTILYKERGTRWYRAALSSEFDLEPLNEGLNFTMDGLDLKLVVQTLLGLPEAIVSADDRWNPISLDNALEAGFQWGAIDNESAGKAFERFFATAVKEATDVRTWMNLLVTHRDQTVLESDVVAVRGSQLTLFDCALPSGKDDHHGSIVGQLEGCSARRKLLGGLNARVVLVRPNWRSLDEHLVKYAKLLNVEVWTQEQCQQMYANLGRMFGVDTSRWQGKLDESGMWIGTETLSSFVSRETSKGFENIDDALAKLVEQDGFAALSIGGTLIVQTAVKQKGFRGWRSYKEGRLWIRLPNASDAAGGREVLSSLDLPDRSRQGEGP